FGSKAYFFSFSAAGAAPGAAAAPSSAGFSSSLAFLAFLTTILTTFTLGGVYGPWPSFPRSSSLKILLRFPRVRTLRARTNWFFRRRLLSIDMVLSPLATGRRKLLRVG